MQKIKYLSSFSRMLPVAILLMFVQSFTPVLAVNKAPLPKAEIVNQETNQKLPPVPTEALEKTENKAQRAILFSAIGLVLLIATVAVISVGTFGSVLPLSILGVAALFGNIGFIKAMRIRGHTKSRKRTFAKARKRAKIALIISCVLGVTLIFGLLHLLMDKVASY